jgi:hypothetical protein
LLGSSASFAKLQWGALVTAWGILAIMFLSRRAMVDMAEEESRFVAQAAATGIRAHAKAYCHLKRIRCTNIAFIPRSDTSGQKTPGEYSRARLGHQVRYQAAFLRGDDVGWRLK